MHLLLQAAAWNVPPGKHPNKMLFTGTLVRVGVASDAPPNRFGGKRIILRAEAAQRALGSLIGMVIVDLAFTGAALLTKTAAAYRSTAISIAAGKTAEHLPIDGDLKMAASKSAEFVDSMQAGAANPLAVPRPLLRLLAAANIKGPADVDRLDEAQLSRLLENKTPVERMGVRQALLQCGLYPRHLPTVSRIPWPS